MPEAIAAPPAAPAAPAAQPAPSPNAAPARPAAPAAPKTSAVRTPASTVGKPAAVAAPAKYENPFDKANADLAKFADPDEDEPKPPGAPKAAPKPAKGAKPAAEPAEPAEELEEGKPPEGEENPAETPEGEVKPEKGKKPSPWILMEKFKARALAAEARAQELEAAHRPGELPKEHQEKFSAIEARNKELEDEIRHVNYAKSKEFQETYQKPYEEAWTRAVEDLKELTVMAEDGSTRIASAHDLIALANMPLGEARQKAKEWFGDSADDVMSHRRVIRELSDKQNKALDESKTKGGEREQQRTAEQKAQQQARSAENAKVWKTINDEAVAKYEYLRPIEGETERNERLTKAQTLVDETLRTSVNQAKTQEERDQILRKHAAVRNRAIGFSVLKHENVGLKAKLAEMEKALAEFQGSEPTPGGLRNSAGLEGGGDEMDAAMGRMTKYVT